MKRPPPKHSARRRRYQHAAPRELDHVKVLAIAAAVVVVAGVGAALIATSDSGHSSNRQVFVNGDHSTARQSVEGKPTTPPGNRSQPEAAPTTFASTAQAPAPTTPPAPSQPPRDQGVARSTPCYPYTGPPAAQLPVIDGSSAGGGEWVTVAELSGNCGGRSAPFTTVDAETRLVYRSDAAHLSVFVIDEADPQSAGGLADVDCQAPCADGQPLTSGPGSYRLAVTATDGPWELLVQQFR